MSSASTELINDWKWFSSRSSLFSQYCLKKGWRKSHKVSHLINTFSLFLSYPTYTRHTSDYFSSPSFPKISFHVALLRTLQWFSFSFTYLEIDNFTIKTKFRCWKISKHNLSLRTHYTPPNNPSRKPSDRRCRSIEIRTLLCSSSYDNTWRHQNLNECYLTSLNRIFL